MKKTLFTVLVSIAIIGIAVVADAQIAGYYYSAGNIGIGTSTPFASLSVSTSVQQSGILPLFDIASTTNTTLFTVLGNGNVGIGTTTPTGIFSTSGISANSAVQGTCIAMKEVGTTATGYLWMDSSAVLHASSVSCEGSATSTISLY